jgi:hypothetical protein
MKGSDKFIEDIAGGQSEYSGETESLCYNAKKKSQYYGIEFQKTHNIKLYEVYQSGSRRVAGLFCGVKRPERYTIFELSRRNRGALLRKVYPCLSIYTDAFALASPLTSCGCRRAGV